MTDKKLAFLISLTFHLLVIFFAYFAVLEVIPQENFQKMEIIEFQSASMGRRASQAPSPTKKSADEKAKASAPEKVNLPNSISNLEEDFSYNIDKGKESGVKLQDDSKISHQSHDIDENADLSDFGEITSDENTSSSGLLEDDYLEGLGQSLEKTENKNKAYLLEGEIKNRQIINKTIPKYPQGIEINGEVRIQFEVNQDGFVKNIIILKKSHHAFETASINSLKKWRFNPISQKTNQKGIITFYYSLK